MVVGRLAQQRPLLVAATALAGSLVLAFAFVGLARVAGPPRDNGQTERLLRRGQPAIAKPAATQDRQPQPSQSALAGTPPSSPPLATATPLAAATHLAAGRYAEAKGAYAELAREQPSNPAYAAVAGVIARQQSVGCQQKPPARSCPQVTP